MAPEALPPFPVLAVWTAVITLLLALLGPWPRWGRRARRLLALLLAAALGALVLSR